MKIDTKHMFVYNEGVEHGREVQDMKVMAKPVDMVAWFTKEGAPKPIRFRLDAEDGESVTINIDRILHKDIEKLAGNPMLVYRCEGHLNGSVRIFEVKYELSTCKWILFKIF